MIAPFNDLIRDSLCAALAELTEQLPEGWQATALSALLILYKEQVDDYPGAEVLARSAT